jgi:uncharacterized protein
MNTARSSIYQGIVVHRRFRPLRHQFRYRVFSLLVDCDELPALGQRLRLFSYNRFNLFSIRDADHGDGTPLLDYVGRLVRQSGVPDIQRMFMLCYPRILGYVFNPLTVYFGLDAEGHTRLVVYEVSNTFGDRKTYVLPAEQDASGAVHQSCAKQLYVSPFNPVDGCYQFHATPIGERLAVTVTLLRDGDRIMSGYFSGRRTELRDAALLAAAARTGWMTVKVIAAIHYEALKLWLKGLRVVKRPRPAPAPVTFLSRPREP